MNTSEMPARSKTAILYDGFWLRRSDSNREHTGYT